MLSISMYGDFRLRATPYAHPNPKIAAFVHLCFGPKNREEMGYFGITPDEAEELAKALCLAADSARAEDRRKAEQS